MGLREQAAADLKTILEDVDGFGWAITVTSPDGIALSLTGFSTDVAQSIDPETGVIVSGRVASVALPMARFTELGMEFPSGVTDKALKPWVIEFNDINGVAHVFKVSEGNPDRAIGIITCTLETYKP